MRFDAAAGGAVPALSAQEMLAAARGLDRVCIARPEEWSRLPGPHMTIDLQWALRNRLRELVRSGEVDGIVVAHGTDTLEETAYLVSRSIESQIPIVFTGAMRNASDLDWDGPANLLDAARVASSDSMRGAGTLVVLGGRIFTAWDVTKQHTHAMDAFGSPGLGPIGVVDEGRVLVRRTLPPMPAPVDCDEPASPVDIVMSFAGADSRLLDALRPNGRAVVIAAMGRGNIPPDMMPGVERWIAEDKPVVIASRIGRGRVGATYGYAGGGRRLLELGAILAGSRRPSQARIELMLALGAGLSHEALASALDA